MSAKVKYISEGFQSITPCLSIRGVAEALEFYKKVFGAVELMRMPMPDGKIVHADIKIGDSHILMGDENPEMNSRSPKTLGGSAVGLMVYVENVDKTVALAVANGAKITRPVENQFYGDRGGWIEDPFGHKWYVATHVEDVPPDELKKRAAAFVEKNKK
jgi:PhnB protein